MANPPAYDPVPSYPVLGGDVITGWDAIVATLPAGPFVLAVDGPAVVPWDDLRARLEVDHEIDLRAEMVDWEKVLARTESPVLSGDPNFATLTREDLAGLFDELPEPPGGRVLVFGPGAALVRHDILWYADLPKRYAEAAVTAGQARNLGQRSGIGTTRRLFYVDWPILDRHRDAIAPRVDRWLDLQGEPRSLTGDSLRGTLASLAAQPFRTRPTFNTTSWGGHWAQRELGMNQHAPNTALGYELIAPESGVLLDGVEVPFGLLVALNPVAVLGTSVHETFGSSFPVRFDYLDTVDGGNLSVHTHPQPAYMRDVFGWPYTQHETYYVMVGGAENRVFLGLRDDADVTAFHDRAKAADEDEIPFRIEDFVRTYPADPHQLFLIPAGTPHGSGEGNVVLEVSATPYLYSLRFFDWLRRDGAGRQRAVHVAHAFANLDPRARTDLVQPPRLSRQGDGWHEELIGALPEMFFEVFRMVLTGDVPAQDDTGDRFHVLNVVEGDGVLIETGSGTHRLVYAETIVIPAAVGPYRLRRLGAGRVRVVKALVAQ